MLVVLPLAAIIAPYRHIHLPRMFLIGIAFFGGLWCVKIALEDVEKLVFVFLLYIPFQKVLPGDFGGVAKAVNFTNVFLILMVLGWLTRVAAVEKSVEAKRTSATGFLMVLFLAVTSVSMAATALREESGMGYAIWANLKRWLMPFAVYFFVTSMVSSVQTVKRMFLAVLVTTAVIGLLGVKQFWMDMGGGSRHNLEGIRIAVTSGPSNLGALFAYYLPFFVAFWFTFFWRPVYWTILIPLAWCLDSLRTTFSRGALLAFLTGALVIVWKKSRLAFICLAVGLVVLFQGRPIRLPYSIFGRMATTYEAQRPGDTFGHKLDTSSRTRLTIWGGGLDMMEDHPLFGVGHERFPSVIGNYRPSVANMDPHNQFLKIGTEMGVPALSLFALLLVVCFRKAWRLHSKTYDPMLKAVLLGYCGAVVGLVVANMFGSRLDSTEISTQFWAMTGGIVVLERRHAANELLPDETEAEVV